MKYRLYYISSYNIYATLLVLLYSCYPAMSIYIELVRIYLSSVTHTYIYIYLYLYIFTFEAEH